MPLAAGTKLGPYEILNSAGAGGMGEVYRARDTRLDRTVAVKISAGQFSERFEREARAVASLNHPHICTLHDIGPNYLVMEYVDGAPLKGPIPLDQALRLGAQIADALDAAHRKGIIHRDLKPSNVLVTKSGVKLLDFGLAKTQLKTMSDETVTKALTGEGTIVGTLQYMSPEQLQGKEADARSDIFALGLVLYEMLTGSPAFQATSQASLIGAILHTEPPPVSSVVPVSPPALDRLIRKCIAKDPDDRWQSARDISSELIWIAECTSQPDAPVSVITRSRRRERLAWMAAAVLGAAAIIAGASAFMYLRHDSPARQVVRFQFGAPEGQSFGPPLISRDSSRIVIPATLGQKDQLWLRSLDSPVLRPLPGTESPRGAAFSPDGLSLAFSSGNALRRTDLTSGATHTLCELPGRIWGPWSWSRDGEILLSVGGEIQRVSASGGAPKPVTTSDGTSAGHLFASFLSDGRHFLYYAILPGPSSGDVMVGSIDDPKLHKRLLQGVGPAAYAGPGWLLYTRDSVLEAQPFDESALELRGEPTPLGGPVAGGNGINGWFYSVSETGTVVWRPGASATTTQLTWFDRAGHQLGVAGEPGEIANPVLSPDGKRVLNTIRDPATKIRDVWILDLTRGVNSRLTFGPADNYNPVWSPDGVSVVFSSSRKGHKDMYRKRADGVGSEEELLVSDVDKNVDSLSPEGKYLLYNEIPRSKPIAIKIIALDGGRKPEVFAEGPRNFNYGQFSPNGRWIAYMSQESGPLQVFVRSAPSSGLSGKWQVSKAGGSMPQWRRDGKELFFLAAGSKLMAVPVKTDGASFEAGAPTALFEIRPGVSLRNHFTVSADGQRFLVAEAQESDQRNIVNVMLNWTALLKKP